LVNGREKQTIVVEFFEFVLKTQKEQRRKEIIPLSYPNYSCK